jgi:hypothetical protein
MMQPESFNGQIAGWLEGARFAARGDFVDVVIARDGRAACFLQTE